MVGKIFKVIFTSKARRRQQQIMDFEAGRVSRAHARKIDREIRKSARQLKALPQSHPYLPDSEEIEPRVRYTKAFSYKIVFTVFEQVSEVVVLTVRNDAEDTNQVLGDLK